MPAKKLLIIDDEESVQMSLRFYFEDEGFDVRVASDSNAALEIVKQEKIPVAIVDIRLPGIDGNEFIRQSHEIDKDIKYIIYTGSSNYVLPETLKIIGITKEDVFTKPLISISRLHDFVKKHFKED